MGWIGRMKERRRLRLLLAQVTAVTGAALSPGLASALAETAHLIPVRLLGTRLKPLYPRLVLIFARQRADGTTRLASGHWSSGDGLNVGMDVLAAEARARTVLVEIGSRRPPSRRPLTDTLNRLNALIEAQRAGPGDNDGYGLATLHEVQRELEELAQTWE